MAYLPAYHLDVDKVQEITIIPGRHNVCPCFVWRACAVCLASAFSQKRRNERWTYETLIMTPPNRTKTKGITFHCQPL